MRGLAGLFFHCGEGAPDLDSLRGIGGVDKNSLKLASDPCSEKVGSDLHVRQLDEYSICVGATAQYVVAFSTSAVPTRISVFEKTAEAIKQTRMRMDGFLLC